MLDLTMIGELTNKQRSLIADKVIDWGNYMFVGLVIAQLVPGTSPFQLLLFLLGVLGMAGAYLIGYLLLKGVKQE